MIIFGLVKLRIFIRYLSGDVEKVVGFGNLEFRERFGLKRKKSRVIKVCKVKEIDEVS